jgi:hypothetical protein
MANIGKWNTPAATQIILSTELNSLANGAMSTASAVIGNSTSLNMYGDWEVVLNTPSPSAGGFVSIYILEAVDTSSFPIPSDADLRLSSTQLLATIPIGTAAATTVRVVARTTLLPPGDFKVKLDNQIGVSFAATLNTLRLNTYNMNLNG